MLAQAGETDFLALCIAVFFDVRLGALEDDAALLFLGLCRYNVSVLLFVATHLQVLCLWTIQTRKMVDVSDSIDPEV